MLYLFHLLHFNSLYLSSSLSTQLRHSFASPFSGTNLSPLSFSLSFSPPTPLCPLKGVLLKIRPGGFFNVSLEVGFFHSVLSPEMPNTHSHNSLIWPCSTIFYLLIDLLLILHRGEIYKGAMHFQCTIHVSHTVLCVAKPSFSKEAIEVLDVDVWGQQSVS